MGSALPSTLLIFLSTNSNGASAIFVSSAAQREPAVRVNHGEIVQIVGETEPWCLNAVF